ncbi:MAG: hypothetical protein ACI9QQ_001651 [Myxococcota bacterium]
MLVAVASHSAAAQPLICVAEGTPVEAYSARLALASAEPQLANVDERWQRTATNGSNIRRGEPITLTWSLVPEGTTVGRALGSNNESNDPSDLRSYLSANYGNEAAAINILQAALDGWSQGPGITFLYEPNDDGVDLNSARGVLGVRGDIRIAGHTIDGNSGTVAYAFFPDSGGDIVIDTDDAFNAIATNLRNVVAHESGHSIGLGHVCPVDQSKLMEPFITTSFDGPQFDDLLGAHRSYGDNAEENDVVDEAVDIGFAVGTTLVADRLALDDNSDDDWYSLPRGLLSEATITLTPAGAPYPFRAISDAICTDVSTILYDPRDNQDMSLTVFDFDGSTIVADADEFDEGGVEALSDVRLSKFGGFIRVGASGVDSVQPYELTVTLVPEPSSTLLTAAAVATLALLVRRQARPGPSPLQKSPSPLQVL